jgi:hypothetical protein
LAKTAIFRWSFLKINHLENTRPYALLVAQRMAAQITIRLDRVGIVSWAPPGAKPPPIKGFKVEYDRFIRSKPGRPAMYERARSMRGVDSDARIAWQYRRNRSWVKPWRITMNGDDQTGILPGQLSRVMRRCRHFRFVLLELAIDFPPALGVDRRFVKRRALFGKSRRDFQKGGKGQLRYGTRHSPKLVRCYWKEQVNAYRVEIELHSQLLGRFGVNKTQDPTEIDFGIVPKHFRFARLRWRALSEYVNRSMGSDGEYILAGARERAATSILKALRFLRRKGIPNVHRFLKPLAMNERVKKAIADWAFEFHRGLND